MHALGARPVQEGRPLRVPSHIRQGKATRLQIPQGQGQLRERRPVLVPPRDDCKRLHTYAGSEFIRQPAEAPGDHSMAA